LLRLCLHYKAARAESVRHIVDGYAMVKKWDKAKRAYEFLIHMNGREVTEKEIADEAGWAQSTASTYINKNWAGILRPTLGKKYVVGLPDGLTWSEFQNLHSQLLIPRRALLGP